MVLLGTFSLPLSDIWLFSSTWDSLGMKMLPGLANILGLLLRECSYFPQVKLFLFEDTASPNGLLSSSFVSSAIFSFSSAPANSRSDFYAFSWFSFNSFSSCSIGNGLTEKLLWTFSSLLSSFFTCRRGDSFKTTLIFGFIFVFFAFT